jgi:hypothetical protein
MAHNGVGSGESFNYPTIFDDGDTLGIEPDAIAELSDMDPLQRVGVMADYLEGKARGGREAAADVFNMLAVAAMEGATELQRAAFVDYFGRMLKDCFNIEVVRSE